MSLNIPLLVPRFSNLFRAALITDPGYDNLNTVDNFWVFLQEGVGLVLAEDIFTRNADTFFAAEQSYCELPTTSLRRSLDLDTAALTLG